MSYEAVIGLEIHAQLLTATKIFCGCSTAFGAPPNASEVAHVAAFLASDEAAQVTGQTISVNGGLSFGGW